VECEDPRGWYGDENGVSLFSLGWCYVGVFFSPRGWPKKGIYVSMPDSIGTQRRQDRSWSDRFWDGSSGSVSSFNVPFGGRLRRYISWKEQHCCLALCGSDDTGETGIGPEISEGTYGWCLSL